MSPEQRRAARETNFQRTLVLRSALLEIIETVDHPLRVHAAATLDAMLNGRPRAAIELTGADGAPLHGLTIYTPGDLADPPPPEAPAAA